jgi:hypothetical protein
MLRADEIRWTLTPIPDIGTWRQDYDSIKTLLLLALQQLYDLRPSRVSK